MCVEVDDANVAVSVHVGHCRRRRPCDRMIAAQDDRNDSPRGNFVDPFADVGVTRFGLTVRTMCIPVIDDFEVVVDLDPEIEVIGARLVGKRSNCPRTKSGTRTVSGGQVERCTDDGDVGLPRVELFRVREKRSVGKGGKPTERVTQVQLLPHSGRQRSIRQRAIRVSHVASVASADSGRTSEELGRKT